MRSNSRRMILAMTVAVCAVSACKNRVNPVTVYPATDSYLVMDFESAASWQSAVNPNLFNLEPPVAGLTFWPYYTSTAVMTRVSGTPFGTGCARKSGTVTGDYSRFAMFLQLSSASGYFDMSAFSGVRFAYRMPALADSSLTNTFRMGVKQTVPPYHSETRTEPPSLGGDCQCRGDDCALLHPYNWDWKCYRHEIPLAYTDDWTQVSYTWGDFTRSVDGYSVEPAGLTGVHLKELVQMEWMSEHRGPDSASFDLYVDEVRFF